MKANYKNIAIELREAINEELLNASQYEAAEKQTWDAAFEVAKTDRAAAEKLFKEAQNWERQQRDAENKVRYFRQALWSILYPLGIDCDTFHPETAEF